MYVVPCNSHVHHNNVMDLKKYDVSKLSVFSDCSRLCKDSIENTYGICLKKNTSRLRYSRKNCLKADNVMLGYIGSIMS